MLQFIINGLITGVLYSLLAIGFALVYNTTKVFHIAAAALYVFAAYMLYWLSVRLGLHIFIAALLSVILTMGLSLLMDLSVYRPLQRRNASGNVAMICNGPWMIGDFSDTSKAPEGFADNVGVAIFPGGFVYDSPIEGMFVTKQDDPALEEAAIAMVKFFTSADAQQKALEMQGMVPASKTVEITDAAKESFPLLADFIDQAAGASVSCATFTGGMVPGLEDLWSSELPNLASGAYTPEELCQILTDFATENAVTE